MEVISFTFLPLYSTGRRMNYPLNSGQGGPKNQTEGFGEGKILVPAWNCMTFSCLSSQLSNSHKESASQAVYTSLRSILIIYFYLWLGLQIYTLLSEILAEKLDAFLFHSNRMCHIVSYLHRLHNLKNISYTDFVFINMQPSAFFCFVFSSFDPNTFFAHFSRALPLCLHTSFYCPAKYTILFPSLLFEYVCDSLRHIITEDNNPRPPLHLFPQQTCSLSQNMFVAPVLVWLPLLSLSRTPQFRNDIVSIHRVISGKCDPFC